MTNVTRIKATDEGSGGDGKSGTGKGSMRTGGKSEPGRGLVGADGGSDGRSVRASDKAGKAGGKMTRAEKKVAKLAEKAEKRQAKGERKSRKLFGPFRYVRDSWREIRQVRWPDRKSTWKMTLSVIIYVAVFGAVIMLLDAFFTFIFNIILGE